MVEARAVAQSLQQAAFQAILKGDRPLLANLAMTTTTPLNEVDALIGRVVVVDASGRVVAACGLSLVPARQHRLTLRGQQFWTWCAFDAIGIPAGLGEDAVAETTCQQCGTAVRVEFRRGELVDASHAEARIWDAQRMEGRGAAGPPHCSRMNLFCSAEHMADWQAAHAAEQGRIRTLAEIRELGVAEWGRLMHEQCCDQ